MFAWFSLKWLHKIGGKLHKMVVSVSLSLSLASFAKNHVFSTLGTLRSFDLWIQKKFSILIPWQRCFKFFFMDLDLREHHFPATWKSRKWSKSTFYILIGLANRKVDFWFWRFTWFVLILCCVWTYQESGGRISGFALVLPWGLVSPLIRI